MDAQISYLTKQRRNYHLRWLLHLLVLLVCVLCLVQSGLCLDPADPEEEEGLDDDPTNETQPSEWEFVEPEVQQFEFQHLRNKKTHVCLETSGSDGVKFAACQPYNDNQLWSYHSTEGRFVNKRSKDVCLKSDRRTGPCSDIYTQFDFKVGRLTQHRSGKSIKAPDVPNYTTASNKFTNIDWELVKLANSMTGRKAFTIEPRYLRFKNQASGKYMGLSKGDLPMLWHGDNVWSYWVFKDGMLVNRAHPFNCISRHPSFGLQTGDCKKLHEWHYDGRSFKNNFTKECIVASEDKQELGDLLLARPCFPESHPQVANQVWSMESVPNVDPGSTAKVIRHVDSGNCVGHHKRKFALAECNSTTRDVLWQFEADTGFIKLHGLSNSEADHPTRCLTRNNLTKTLRLGPCNDGARWDYDSWQLHHRSPNNYCLDDYWNRHEIESDILAHDCQPIDSLGQRFHLEEPPLVPAPVDVGLGYQFVVDADGANCVGVSETKRVSLASCNDSPSIRWLYDSHNGYIRSRRDHDWCLGKPVDSRRLEVLECGHPDSVWFHDGEMIRLLKAQAPGSTHAESLTGWHFEAAPNKDVGISPVQIKLGGMCAKVSGEIIVADVCGKSHNTWWTYEPSSGYIRSRASRNKCLARPVDSSKLKLGDCDQMAQWDYDGSILRHRSTIHDCLDTLYAKSDPGDPMVTVSCWNVVNEVVIE